MIRSEFITSALIAFFAFSCSSKQAQPPASDKTSDKIQTFAAPKVISIADLPDSLQPKTIFLDKVPKPLRVSIPTKEGGFYSRKYGNGDITKIMMKPPVKKMLAVLTDEKGRPVKDAAGNPFIMGGGGHSNFTNFNSDDGLALNAVICSIMDKEGNLWFGTQGGGASRYDGKSFTNFNATQGLLDNNVRSIFQDRAGDIWFGTQSGGASKYDGNSFTSFTTDQGLSSGSVLAIFQDKAGNMWFGTTRGVSKYDGKTFTVFSTKDGLPNNVVTCIGQDRLGNMWLCTSGGLCKYDGKSFIKYTTAQGLAGNLVNCMAEAKDGVLWFGTNNGVSKYDGKTFTNYTSARGLSNDVVQAISEDWAGNLWFGTFGGLTKYDGKTFTNYTTAQGLPDNNIKCITEDRAGNLWVGTSDGGVSKYSGNTFTSFTTADGLPNNVVFYIDQDRAGNYWFCTTDGLSKYDGRSFTNFTISQGLANSTITCMTEDKAGNLWFGENNRIRGGVSKYDGRSFTTFTTEQGLAANSVYQILEDKAGNLWFGTTQGLSRFDGKSFTNYTSAQSLINNFINALCLDKEGNLWVGTSAGVSRFDGKTFINFTSSQGLSNDQVNSINEDSYGNLWIATQGGVSRLSAKELDKLKPPYFSSNGKTEVTFDNFTTAQGLADDQVYGSVQDKKGNMFIGTNLGFTVIPAEMSVLPFSEVRMKLEYYNRPNGYPVRDLNTDAMYCDSQGIIWGGTGTGLVRFDYGSLHKEAGPVLVIQKVKVNGENICWFDLASGEKLSNAGDSAKSMFQESMAYGKMITPADRDSVIKRFGGIRFDSISRFTLLPQNLALPYHQNQVAIDFNAIETSKPQQVEYQYMLQGYDKEWSPVTKNTTATFGNMDEGSYNFMVKARKSNGDWSKPLTYSFKVLPPWYRTWWAYGLYIVAFVLAALAFGRLLRHRVIAKERQESEFREAKLKAEAENEQRKNIELISEMGKDITASLSIGHIINTVYAHVNKLMDASIFGIGIIDKDKQKLEFPATKEKGGTLSPYSYYLDDKKRPASWCFNNKKEIFMNDFEKEHQAYISDIADPTEGQNSDSIMYLPLIYKEKSIGVITAQSFSKNAYNEYHLNILRSLATYTAVALDNADAYRSLKSTQAQLLQSEKMASLGELTAGIAHEIQNPLNFVNNFSEVNRELIQELKNEILSDNKQQAISIANDIDNNEEKINHHGKRADAIVKGMLQHSRSSTGVKEPTDINALADEYLRLSYHGLRAKDKSFNAEMKTDFDNSIGKINIIPQEIGRVLLNLYNNAFYAVSEKVKQQPDGYESIVSVTTKKINNKVEITVKDNGNGISQKVIDKIFQPFFTTKPTGVGTGLGLSLSYDIVKAHGGEIKVNTIEGEGTEFTINLPVA